ncbi:hypothetical protein BWQ96_06643 [Gracilariopsis chorda]|uniref:Endonuclease/exonuclease/phosphatase domain-containing protein n=1 Tax=Gracilariopsis chorda TaxID=448386 RepID=A0A2V3INI3_9FLOR|nr:hypothetical protein BWQ96_06643 [Gracilariopsis chorda]|eukprot:PXF43634.1 hypothetical protein BWQ96_06643 [Gracilariopsis chorda]
MTVTCYVPAVNEDVTLSGVYTSPSLTQEDLAKLLYHLSATAGGAVIILGDFNALHTDWDTTTSLKGSTLRSLVIRQHYGATIPVYPTYKTALGSSVVDFLICKGLDSVCCTIRH